MNKSIELPKFLNEFLYDKSKDKIIIYKLLVIKLNLDDW